MNNSVGPAARRVGRALGDLAPAAIKQPTSPPYTEVTREHVEAAGHRWPLLVDRVDLVRLFVGEKDAHAQALDLVGMWCPGVGALLLRGSSINFRESSGRRSSDGSDRSASRGRLS